MHFRFGTSLGADLDVQQELPAGSKPRIQLVSPTYQASGNASAVLWGLDRASRPSTHIPIIVDNQVRLNKCRTAALIGRNRSSCFTSKQRILHIRCSEECQSTEDSGTENILYIGAYHRVYRLHHDGKPCRDEPQHRHRPH